MPRPSRALVCCLLLSLVAGCSSTRFFYNRLDFLVPWYLSRYVDLERDQRELLDRRVDDLLEWHRRSELPRYAALLSQAEAALDEELTPATVESLALAAEDEWLRLRDRGLDELIQVGEALSDGQIAGFIDALRERQMEYEKKYLARDDALYVEEACESLVDRLADYMGRLSREQRSEACAVLADLQRSDAAWLAERERWVDWLETTLRRQGDWQAELREGVASWAGTVPDDYRALYSHNATLIYRAVAQTVEGRSERQDQRLRRKLASLREDANRLSAG